MAGGDRIGQPGNVGQVLPSSRPRPAGRRKQAPQPPADDGKVDKRRPRDDGRPARIDEYA
jgi:hypothetical protein